MATAEEIQKLLNLALAPIKEHNSIISSKFEKLLNEIDSFRASQNKMEEKINQLEKALAMKNKTIEKLEMKTREKNIILYGVKEDNNKNLEHDIVQIFRDVMKVDHITNNNIEAIRRLGRPKENRPPRPVLIELSSKKLISELFRGARHLKGTNIYIEHDYPQNIAHERKLLKPHLTKVKSKGFKAYLRNDKIVVDGKEYSLNELKDIDLLKYNVPNDDTGNKEDDSALGKNENLHAKQSENAKNNSFQQSLTLSSNNKIDNKKDKIKGPLDHHIITRARTQSVSKNSQAKTNVGV